MTLLQLNHTMSCCDQTSFCNSSHPQIASLPRMIHWLSIIITVLHTQCIAIMVQGITALASFCHILYILRWNVRCFLGRILGIGIIESWETSMQGVVYLTVCCYHPHLFFFTFKSSFSKHSVNASWNNFQVAKKCLEELWEVVSVLS